MKNKHNNNNSKTQNNDDDLTIRTKMPIKKTAAILVIKKNIDQNNGNIQGNHTDNKKIQKMKYEE